MQGEYLTIGQMAEANQVSKKTLLYYQEQGLLEPSHVDESNGRRYYDENQSYILDIIQRLQTLGVPLSTVKEAVYSYSPEEFAELLTQQVEINKERALVLAATIQANEELLKGAQTRIRQTADGAVGMPPLQIVELEAFPMLVFTYQELGIPPVPYDMHPNCLGSWRNLMRASKRALLERVEESGVDIPVPLLFQRVGTIGTAKDLKDGQLTCKSFFVGIPAALKDKLRGATEMPAGKYLSLTGECESFTQGCGGQCINFAFTKRLLDFAKNHTFKTDGLCYTEDMTDPLALRAGNVETLTHTRLRIFDE